ncbi:MULTISPECIES: DUF2690 domain-containing protein [unclassified Streptomyces]|uniref:DUF2690 domain-containing protein n=1 Tax=unclassified Streptomyces TaxID=2593676 RepID=UPI002E80EFCE|nr:DUF2690 domain-containing protein [Streptomyces sp. NBC_00523]WUD01105.1 YjfA family protein [Streptomyces sp. NBC_00523]
MQLARTLKHATAVAAAVAGLALGLSGSADAAARDGADPMSSGCASGAYTARSQALYVNGARVGTVELRYSPSCRTVWARVWSDGNSVYAKVVRDQDNSWEYCGTPHYDSASGQYSCYTPMLNDADYTSYAVGGASESSGRVGSALGYTGSY